MLEFVQHGFGAVDGRRKTDADVALRSQNGGVDADDRAVRIQQRAAAVAGVDGGVGLDQAFQLRVFLGLQASVERADDARSQGSFESEGVADGEHFLPNH